MTDNLINNILKQVQEVVFPNTIDFSNPYHVFKLKEVLSKNYTDEAAELFVQNMTKLVFEKENLSEDIKKEKKKIADTIQKNLFFNKSLSEDNKKLVFTTYGDITDAMTDAYLLEHLYKINETEELDSLQFYVDKTSLLFEIKYVDKHTDDILTEVVRNATQFFLKELVRMVPKEKEEDFNHFIKKITTQSDLAKQWFKDLFREYDVDKFNQLLEILYSKSKIEDVKFQDMTTNSVSEDLVNMKPEGIGKGEMLFFTLVKDCEVMGGNTDYDLTSAGKKYEVKDYSNPDRKYTLTSPIQLGVVGKISNFPVYSEIQKTYNAVNAIEEENVQEFGPELAELINTIKSRSSIGMTGEFPGMDFKVFNEFYEKMNQLKNDFKIDYSKVIFKGKSKNVEKTILPISDEDIVGGEINLKILDTEDIDMMSRIMYSMNDIKYISQPDEFVVDLKLKTVEKIMSKYNDENIQFIILRKNEIRYPTEFRYATTSRASVKIKEKIK